MNETLLIVMVAVNTGVSFCLVMGYLHHQARITRTRWDLQDLAKVTWGSIPWTTVLEENLYKRIWSLTNKTEALADTCGYEWREDGPKWVKKGK